MKSAHICEKKDCAATTLGSRRGRRLMGPVNYSKQDRQYLHAVCRGRGAPGSHGKRLMNRQWPTNLQAGREAVRLHHQKLVAEKTYHVTLEVLQRCDAAIDREFAEEEIAESWSKIRAEVFAQLRRLMKLGPKEMLTQEHIQMLNGVVVTVRSNYESTGRYGPR